MTQPAATRAATVPASPWPFAAVLARAVMAVLGLVLLVVLVMAWAPQLVDPLLLALGL